MLNCIVMVGLQGSGKSIMAEYLKADMGNCEIVSSDSIRKEFNNNITNDKVFKIYYERVRELLKKGINVILDATNITIKSRKQIFEQLKGIDCTKCCYIVNTPYEQCLKNLDERNKKIVKNGLLELAKDLGDITAEIDNNENTAEYIIEKIKKSLKKFEQDTGVKIGL